jgi:acetylornithine deacetylase/succinyl-diaminopimelate desuccinylase-like protein
MIDKDRLVRTLQDLVRIPSHESMKEISEHVAGEIRKLGLKPDVDEDGNVLVFMGSGPSLVLNSHLDTVGVNGYPEAFSGEVKGDKLYGRGSTDDKSGVAAMLELMKVLKKDPTRKKVTFAFTVWEEGGGSEKDGAYKVVKDIKPSHDAKPTHALVLESSAGEDGRMAIEVGCKGRFVYKVDVLGEATHSGSRSGSDKNAIYLASELISRLKGFGTISQDIPVCGKVQSYLSVTQIHAMEGNNIIPGRCTLTVDYRALPGEDEKEVRARLESTCKDVLGSSFRVSHLLPPKDGYLQTDPDFIGICKKGIEETGLKPYTKLSSGWMDAAVFNDAGIITLNAGPGTRGQAHKTPEHCWIPGLVKGTEAILNVIRGWDSP